MRSLLLKEMPMALSIFYLGFLLSQTFGALASCPGLIYTSQTAEIQGICGNHVDICAARETNANSVQAFNRDMKLTLWKKAKKMDKSFNNLYDRYRLTGRPSPTAECHSCMETLLPHSLPHGNITEQQMEDSLSADYTMLAKVVGTFIRMREDCEQIRSTHRHILVAENKAKQLMCQIGHSLSVLGGDLPCEPLNLVLTPWCQISNCFDWNERNFLVMDKLIITSQALKSKFRRVSSSQVIRCTN